MSLAHAQTFRWSAEQYARLEEILPRGVKVELIEGDIVTVPPMNPPHANAVMRANSTLMQHFIQSHFVRVRLPLSLGDYSEPEPDFALVTKASAFDRLGQRHPVVADLVVEVSDSSLAYDRDEKASLYARDGIAEYWIVNLVDRVLEVYRDPAPDPNARFGASWRSCHVHGPEDYMAPLFEPSAQVKIAALF